MMVTTLVIVIVFSSGTIRFESSQSSHPPFSLTPGPILPTAQEQAHSDVGWFCMAAVRGFSDANLQGCYVILSFAGLL